MPTTTEIVQKLWSLCHVLRDDGITYATVRRRSRQARLRMAGVLLGEFSIRNEDHGDRRRIHRDIHLDARSCSAQGGILWKRKEGAVAQPGARRSRLERQRAWVRPTCRL